MESIITEDIIARQAPEAQAIIRVLLAKIAKLEAQIEELRRQAKGKTPQNSSLPPSTQHPHAKPAPRKRKSKKKRGGQSKRRTAEFLSTLLGQPCCSALTVKMQTQVTAALRGAYEELAAQLPMQEQVSADETPTKERNGKAWLWTFVARTFTVFAVRATREAAAANMPATAARKRRLVVCRSV